MGWKTCREEETTSSPENSWFLYRFLGVQLATCGAAANSEGFHFWGPERGKYLIQMRSHLFLSHPSSLRCPKISWAGDNGGFWGEKGLRGWGINHHLSVCLIIVPPRANTEGNSRTIGFLESSAYQTSQQAPFAQVCSVLITQAQAALETKGDLQTTHSLSHRIRRKLILPKNCWRPVGREERRLSY